MNIFKGTLDTRQQNGVIASINQFDNATLELKIVTDGQIDNVWDEPRFELIGMKRDNNPVREVEQDHFTILSKEVGTTVRAGVWGGFVVEVQSGRYKRCV